MSNRSGSRKQHSSGHNRKSHTNKRPYSRSNRKPVGKPHEGVLHITRNGYGILNTTDSTAPNMYVSAGQINKFQLQNGDCITGQPGKKYDNTTYPPMVKLISINEQQTISNSNQPHTKFESLTPLFPDMRLRLERANGPVATRIIDLITPVGKGQRGLIVAPPKTGKTTILTEIAKSLKVNHPEVRLMVVLVGERPEEVTEIRNTLNTEVFSATFDSPDKMHIRIAEDALKEAKRTVEDGKDVVILLDSITRLARAYNLNSRSTGRVLSGGVESNALYPPKQFFGSARNLEEGGSLTILATALIETGSRMDDVIFEEFKGTGNLELRLDRSLAERGIFPAVDIAGSGTRREELLMGRKELDKVRQIRRALADVQPPHKGISLLTDRLRATAKNSDFLKLIASNR